MRSYSSVGTEGAGDGGSVIGPLIGLRRPRYEILREVIGDFISGQTVGEDVFFFVNLTSMLRHFFSEYSVAQLTRGELNRHPRLLAAELLNLVGHYRNYVWKHHGRHSTVIMYHSTNRCPLKLAISEDYKASIYSKRIGGAAPEFDLVRGYVAFNIRIARFVAERIPHVHIVDTGVIDPEVWPWALASEGRVTGSALLLSGWRTDLQYASVPVDFASGRSWGVLHASGEHTRLVTREGLIAEALRESKQASEIASKLSPEHFAYMLAIAGDPDLGSSGIPGYGLAKAAKHVAKCVAEGRLPPGSVSLEALLEDGRIPDGHAGTVRRCWELLVHEHHASRIAPDTMSAIDAQMVNLSGLGELEKANVKYFDGVLNLELLHAGERGY